MKCQHWLSDHRTVGWHHLGSLQHVSSLLLQHMKKNHPQRSHPTTKSIVIITIIIIRTWRLTWLKQNTFTQYIIKIHSHEKGLSNKKVFSCLLNTVNEGAKLTLAGRLFHACATITRNKQSPIVRSRVCDMISRWREPERRRCSAGISGLLHIPRSITIIFGFIRRHSRLIDFYIDLLL